MYVCLCVYLFAFVRCMRIYKFTGALQPSAECHVHFQSMRSSTRFSTQLRCSTKSASSYAIPENCIWFVPTSRCVDILCMYVHVYQRTSVYKIVTLWVSIKRVALCMPPGATWVMQTRKGQGTAFQRHAQWSLWKLYAALNDWLRRAAALSPRLSGTSAGNLSGNQLFFVAFTAVRAGKIVAVAYVVWIFAGTTTGSLTTNAIHTHTHTTRRWQQ